MNKCINTLKKVTRCKIELVQVIKIYWTYERQKRTNINKKASLFAALSKWRSRNEYHNTRGKQNGLCILKSPVMAEKVLSPANGNKIIFMYPIVTDNCL